MTYKQNTYLGNSILPVDIVLAPEWWYTNENITFDRDFFYHPLKRVEAEQRMERVLYERWGKFGMGEHRDQARPEIGAVHLAAGFLLSEMLGCQVKYSENHPPQVIPAHQELRNITADEAFRTSAFQQVTELADSLRKKYGYLTGDINWGGILNIAMDLRGENIFLDMMMTPDEVKDYFAGIAGIIEKFTSFMQAGTGTTSISVNRGVRHMQEPVLLHSECSHTMISEEDYENFLLPFDQEWSKYRPFGIHYCGPDPHRMAASFAKIPHLDYIDLGWGGDVKILREHLPDTFFNIRLSPVEVARQSQDEIRETIIRLVHDSGNPYLTGVCCINMDDSVSDDRITTIFETVEELRKEASPKSPPQGGDLKKAPPVSTLAKDTTTSSKSPLLRRGLGEAKKFDIQLSDAQATQVIPVRPEDFDFARYEAYASELNETCARFRQQPSGVAVYRRMRVGECFSYGCRDMKRSLELQLGALEKSMLFKADVPNFLEPWYGIGTVAGAFGGDYIWHEGNAPALKTRFSNIDEVLAIEPQEIAQTRIGKHTLEMIGYFMDQTKGRVPVSLTDTQSPLNMIGHLVPLDQFFMDILLEPEKVMQLFDRLADLSVRFNQEQVKLIGSALASPGHGFASSTQWGGLGMSDDNAIMISPEQYLVIAAPSVEKICNPLGGPAFHACGDWSGWVDAVLQIKGLTMADGAFSPQTDPGATNNLEAFHRFAHTGIVLNARIVGDLDTIREQVSRLWVPGMKLVAVTYCETPGEQEEAYHSIHEICSLP